MPARGKRHHNYRHGQSSSPAYRSWEAMIQRCTNPARNTYYLYGGRGISVCERWRTFVNFLADMGERPAGTSLDRIDNNGNYEPGNCRWATVAQQHANRRHLIRSPKPRIQLAGRRVGRLTVLSFAGVTAASRGLWRCRCDCGGERHFVTWQLTAGKARSCGCLQPEVARSLQKKLVENNRLRKERAQEGSR